MNTFPWKEYSENLAIKNWTNKILPKLFLGQHYVAACFQNPGFM